MGGPLDIEKKTTKRGINNKMERVKGVSTDSKVVVKRVKSSPGRG